jgi:hypothetical protein
LVKRKRRSGADFDRSTVGNQTPDLLDLSIRDGDAAVGPVLETMRSANPSIPAREAADDTTTGIR